MRGLLLKDFYLTMKYCRAYLFIIVAFVIGSLASFETLFYIYYPCILAGMIPVTLLGYDERSKWQVYSGVLPVTKAQVVSSKYIIGLLAEGFVLLLAALSRIISMKITGEFQWTQFAVLMTSLFAVACFSSSVCLPFMFKLGVEKGRMAYYIMIGAVCALSFIVSDVYKKDLIYTASLAIVLPVIIIISIFVFALSWYLSAVFYKGREIV